jgi:DNA-binding transcriptional regulator YdaS (Cro superfamily)
MESDNGSVTTQALTGMEAVRERISLAKLAEEIGVTRGAVYQWSRVPAERVGEVSRITGISVMTLRPDIFMADAKEPAQ